jgi:succinate dehydrogenase/fumarate reductase flavoprotein subunit
MNEPQSMECDVLVIGSGAGGLAAAVAAAVQGLDVLVIEKEPYLGGTTAQSGGWLWVPCSPLARRAGINDTPEKATTYLQHETGGRYDDARTDAFLATGPEMIDFFERETAVRFFLGADYPDYHPDVPGALPGGRAVCALPFDGRALGENLRLVRMPPRQLTLFGLKVGSGPDYRHFANAQRSLRSALYVGKRVLAHCAQVVLYGRDVTLMSGNALVGRLVKSALDRGARLKVSTAATALTLKNGCVVGATAAAGDRAITIVARRGVVCAAGGFSHDLARCRRLYPQCAETDEHYSLACTGNTGDGLRIAEAVGAAVDESGASPAAWMPMSCVPCADGSFAMYPHSFDRGKPGVIAVTADARRSVNEGNSYHDVGEAMIRAMAVCAGRAAFLICDSAAIRRYGLGMARPFPVPLAPHLRSGYLKRGRTLDDLAAQTGMDARTLNDTVRRFNADANEGRDSEFGRGANIYNVYQGDPANRPSPCVAPLDKPPYYAVQIYPGDLSTFAGLRTDRHARVLSTDGAPIPGLYAAGCDMASIFGGHYPGPGINLGPALTFGYIAARHLAQQPSH